MRKRIDGARVLITGAGGGIGASLALELVARGARSLVLVDVDEAALARVRARIDGSSEAATHVVDLTDGAAVAALIERVGEIDVLVNGAGISVPGRFANVSLASIERTIDINLVAAVRLTRLVLPKMRRGGCLVNIASASGLMAPGGLAAYAASKFGLVGFSEALRVELAERDIAVMVVCPAFVRTGILAKSAAQLGDDDQRRAESAAGARQAEMMEAWGIDAEALARKIVTGIENGERVIVTSLWAKALIALRRVSPRVAEAVLRFGWRRMVRQGLVE
ncbi:MAG: SDR family NAD(P)-dependent oxidoreductase [Deltaproteobacteria bacterium]|nr:SDR family NAD(P)-dependent oxidoreductase [Deltaproteobacteria bacterium]